MASSAASKSQSPLVMTFEQINQLTTLFADAHKDNRSRTVLLQAANGIDRCDGAIPENTRAWIR